MGHVLFSRCVGLFFVRQSEGSDLSMELVEFAELLEDLIDLLHFQGARYPLDPVSIPWLF